ncbi:MAG TPA: peptide permease [Chloroflexi bacterium]|nr:peptide permease [Chloroflexota bacterium]
MTQYIIRRVLISIPLLFGITLIIFALANLMPGDALTAMITDEAPISGETLAVRRAQLGLDKPIPIQYLIWIRELAQGNLGYSFVIHIPIGPTIARRVPATLELMGLSLLFSIIIGVSLGVISALKQYSVLDYILTVLGFAGSSIPIFFLGLLLIDIFALTLGWLPPSGIGTAGEAFSLKDNLKHLLLPALSLGVLRTAVFMRYTRASMLEVLRSEYMTTARAKGLRERTVVIRHGFRNALMPIITIIGLNLPVLFGGAVIIETVFQWPGMGLLYITAVRQRDYPMIMGLALISSVAVLLSNLLTDIAYAFADPRIRYD